MSAQLFQPVDVEEQWRAVVRPWLRTAAVNAWREARPTVVLTPSRAEGFYLRSRLVDEGVSFLGIRFWTPSDARVFLLAGTALELEPATQAELDLVARVCAEKVLEYPTPEDEPSLASVARQPGPFLRAYDLLLGAGWEPALEGAAYGRRLAAELERTLAERKIATQAGLHRALRRAAAADDEPLLAGLLMVGFNAAHWPLWDLLQATVIRAKSATVSLISPRGFGEKIDQLWTSSWEQEAGTTVVVPSEPAPDGKGSFEAWIDACEQGAAGDISACNVKFMATADLTSQVQAVTLQALEYLQSDSCQRLGIVFPEENALALGVADQLRRLGVPLDDGTGYLQPGCFERRHWQAWLKLQEEPSVGRLTDWLRACDAEAVFSGATGSALKSREIARALDEALGESLVDHLDFLALYLEEKEDSSRRRIRGVAEFLRDRIQLPEQARFSEFLSLTCRAAETLDWQEHLAQLRADPPAWLRDSSWTISRRAFLEWLKESTDSRERTRGAEGNHFYGKVHLLIYAQMPGQTWTHLICTGLNEGRWPRLYEAGAFGSRHELMTLNQQAKSLNLRGTAQGSQGAGHEVVRADRGYCLLPLDRQDLALRDLCAAIAATSEAVCLTAMTTEAGRMLLPSDFFTYAYQAKTGRPLDEAEFRALALATRERCRRHDALWHDPESKSRRSAVEATRIAYEARRDPAQPFGRYEFALEQPPADPIQLSCKTWEEAWNHPASVWLKSVLGVEAWPDGTLAWPRAIGTWVHRWLATSLRAGGERKTPDDFLRELRATIGREPEIIRALTERAGIALYPWWNHVWNQARSVTLGLGEELAPQLKEKHFLCEYRLPENLKIALPGTEYADFVLRGRIDLLLLDSGAHPFDPTGGSFTDCACWVIDFKTGAAKNLSPKKLEKGIGLQAMLYALAVRAAGVASVDISLQTFDAPLKAQVKVEDVLAGAALFHSLDRFHRDGVFGMRPGADSDYSFSPKYPMATRMIPKPVLESKWALVHGTPPGPEEES